MPRSEQDSTGRWLTRTAGGAAIKAVVQHVTVTYVIPLGVPLVTAYLAYLEGWPWSVVLTVACLAFGGLATALVRFDDWIEKRRVRDKLNFADVRLGRAMHRPDLALGVGLRSIAAVPIEFEVQEVQTRLADRVPPRLPYETTRFIVPPHGEAWFYDFAIDTTGMGGTLDGLVEMKIRYGRVGALKYNLILKKRVSVLFKDDGQIEAASWQDAA